MKQSDDKHQIRLRHLDRLAQQPSVAPGRDAQYERAVNDRLAIELNFEAEMYKATCAHQAKMFKIGVWGVVSVFSILVFGLGALVVQLIVG